MDEEFWKINEWQISNKLSLNDEKACNVIIKQGQKPVLPTWKLKIKKEVSDQEETIT